MSKLTVPQSQLIQELAQRCHLSPAWAQTMIDALIQELTAALKEDKTITLRQFGTFKRKSRTTYMGRNPKTGQQIKIASKKLSVFRVSSTYIKELNQGIKTP